jgi:hypothetical protein
MNGKWGGAKICSENFRLKTFNRSINIWRSPSHNLEREQLFKYIKTLFHQWDLHLKCHQIYGMYFIIFHSSTEKNVSTTPLWVKVIADLGRQICISKRKKAFIFLLFHFCGILNFFPCKSNINRSEKENFAF